VCSFVIKVCIGSYTLGSYYNPGLPVQTVHVDRLSGASTVLFTFTIDRGVTWEVSNILKYFFKNLCGVSAVIFQFNSASVLCLHLLIQFLHIFICLCSSWQTQCWKKG
jgi:hypothetical protein